MTALLPGTAYITRRGHTCRLYGPEAIILGLELVKDEQWATKAAETQREAKGLALPQAMLLLVSPIQQCSYPIEVSYIKSEMFLFTWLR